MKKSILLSLFIAFGAIVNTAMAQKGAYIGAQGTVGMSGMFNSDDLNDEQLEHISPVATSFGLGGGYNFHKHMGVGAEVMYSIEGQKYEKNNIEVSQRMNYIKIPVLFSYNTNPNAKVMFTAKAGPQIGILASSKLKDGDGNDIIDDTNEKFESVTFGAMAGVGARAKVANNLFVDAGLRFDGAFTNSENEEYKSYTAGRAKTYNMNAGVEVGVKYILK